MTYIWNGQYNIWTPQLSNIDRTLCRPSANAMSDLVGFQTLVILYTYTNELLTFTCTEWIQFYSVCTVL
jgi:hypothetical protein